MSPAKFTFDLDLANRPKKEEVEPKQVLSDAALAMLIQNARQEGYTQGFTEGERGVAAREAQAVTIAAQALASQAQAMLTALDNTHRQHLAEAVELAGAIGRKLATHLIACEPAAELAALIDECFVSLEGVPHLVIRCHPDLGEKVREIATNRMTTSSFTGRLVVLGDPELPLGDGRIEWADGGLVRSFSAISEEIDGRIAAYLAAHGAAPASQDDTQATEQE